MENYKIFPAINCLAFKSKLTLPFELQIVHKDMTCIIKSKLFLIDEYSTDGFYFGRTPVEILKTIDENTKLVSPISISFPEKLEIEVPAQDLICFCDKADCKNCEFGKDIFANNPYKIKE